jgi:hypothetical protein
LEKNMSTYDERAELNRVTLVALEDQRRELMTLIEASKILNLRGLAMPLTGIDRVLGAMFESYSVLKN